MMNFLKRIIDIKPSENAFHRVLLFLRVVAGFALIKGHGWDKLVHYDAHLQSIPDPLGFGAEISLIAAIFADLICALLVTLGLFTRLAVLPILITVLIGFFIVHGNDPWATRELPFLYAILFAPFLILGAGKYSMDHWICQRLQS